MTTSTRMGFGIAALLLCAIGLHAQAGPPAAGGRGSTPPLTGDSFLRQHAVHPLSPDDQASHFLLPPGFSIEPVLAEPHIQEPAQIAFDGNGRMFVLELRGYMQDADGAGTLSPVGRISRHEDVDGDGVYDSHTIFVDRLVFPRFVTPLGDGVILTKESNADEVWRYTDTDADGIADRKELFATGMGRALNVEHQESGLMWAMDNWLYSTINQVRLRATRTGVRREATGANASQWGVTQDNYGKVWFQGGASGMPGYFQFPVVYGYFRHPAQFEPDLDVTWGAPVLIGDMQGGANAIRMPDGSLRRGTGAAGNDVFRGHRLPADMVGDYFYGEPVGRIVRRLRPANVDGITRLGNVYPFSEFIRSTDPLFRPVDMTTAPDGTLYITDMYRGIIQESQWSGPGTYLRQRIEQYGLDQIVRHGRIWRVTHESFERDRTRPRMHDESPSDLVAHLAHPNGWWRDTAQQLLVIRQDTSVVPALQNMARSSGQLARIHALWTLEGLEAIDATFLRPFLNDADPRVRVQAIRVSESLYKAGDRSFGSDYVRMTADADTDVVIQALLTLNTLKVPGAADVLRASREAHHADGVRFVTSTILDAAATPCTYDGCAAPFSPEETAVMERGAQIYTEVCFACHGDDGRGERGTDTTTSASKAPPLAGAPRVIGHRHYVIKSLLHGLTGPLDGTEYQDVMIAFGQNSDDWIAAVASYVRNAFGNRSDFVTAADVAAVRAATATREAAWRIEDIETSLPRLLVTSADWTLTASHNAQIAANALTINPWTSGEPQRAGMWFQVELPRAASLTALEFESVPVALTGRGALPTVPGAPTRSVEGRGAAGAIVVRPPGPPGIPGRFDIQTSIDGTTWTTVAGNVRGAERTTVEFTPTTARLIRIALTTDAAADAPLWTMRNLRVYEAAQTSP